jgi:hypothetical protein
MVKLTMKHDNASHRVFDGKSDMLRAVVNANIKRADRIVNLSIQLDRKRHDLPHLGFAGRQQLPSSRGMRWQQRRSFTVNYENYAHLRASPCGKLVSSAMSPTDSVRNWTHSGVFCSWLT